jgi:hypothetical protein
VLADSATQYNMPCHEPPAKGLRDDSFHRCGSDNERAAAPATAAHNRTRQNQAIERRPIVVGIIA